jgi:hypothetical protein
MYKLHNLPDTCRQRSWVFQSQWVTNWTRNTERYAPCSVHETMQTVLTSYKNILKLLNLTRYHLCRRRQLAYLILWSKVRMWSESYLISNLPWPSVPYCPAGPWGILCFISPSSLGPLPLSVCDPSPEWSDDLSWSGWPCVCVQRGGPRARWSLWMAELVVHQGFRWRACGVTPLRRGWFSIWDILRDISKPPSPWKILFVIQFTVIISYDIFSLYYAEKPQAIHLERIL